MIHKVLLALSHLSNLLHSFNCLSTSSRSWPCCLSLCQTHVVFHMKPLALVSPLPGQLPPPTRPQNLLVMQAFPDMAALKRLPLISWSEGTTLAFSIIPPCCHSLHSTNCKLVFHCMLCAGFSSLHLLHPPSFSQNINSTNAEADAIYPQHQELCLAQRGRMSVLWVHNKSHYFSTLIQHPFITSQSCRSGGVLAQGGWVLQPAQGTRSWNQGGSQAKFFSGYSGEESASKFLQTTDKIQPLEAVRLRSSFSC